MTKLDFSSMTEQALIDEINGHHAKVLSTIDPRDRTESRKLRAAILKELRQRVEDRTPSQEAR